MKKLIALFMMIGLFLLTPGCGPSEAEYQQVKDENERLKKELANITQEYEICQEATYDYYEKERPMLEARIEALEAQRNTANTAPASASPTTPAAATVEPQEPEPPARTSSGYYVVRRGDTINGIAIKMKVSKRDLMRVNNIRNEARIFAGQRLKLPTGSSSRAQARPRPAPEPEPAPTPPPRRTTTPEPEPAPQPSPSASGGRIVFYYVRPNDTLPRIAAKTRVSVETLKRLNGIDDDTPLRVGQRLFLR